MSQDKVTKFMPGTQFMLDRKIIFVEYESMTGELVKCRFDLSQKTEMLLNDYRILSFDDLTYLYSKGEELFIKKVLYYEKECHMVIGDKLLIPTKVYFENAGYQQAYETNNKLLRQVANSAYGISSRDWGDVLADSARYIHMLQSRCNGKTLWLSSTTSFADKQPLWNIDRYHDICEQWLKEPPKPVQFISDDLEDCEKGVPNTKLIDPTTLYFQDTTTGEMKPYEGIKNLTPKPMHFRGKTWTHPESPYGKQGHMLIVDISSKTFPALRDDDYLDVEVGDVMWYDDGNNGKAEPDDHGKPFVWRGLGVGWEKLSDGNGCFDTDTAMTKEETLYCRNDVAVTEKFFKEEKKMKFDSCKPTIKNVIFNDPATIVMWSDGTKTVVKCDNSRGDVFDPEKGIAMCCMKKLLGTNKTGSNYLDKVEKYLDKYDEAYTEERKTIGEILKEIWHVSFGSTQLPVTDVCTDAMDIPEETENPGLTDEALKEVAEGGENNE